jgi:hypothetical protein
VLETQVVIEGEILQHRMIQEQLQATKCILHCNHCYQAIRGSIVKGTAWNNTTIIRKKNHTAQKCSEHTTYIETVHKF